MIVRDDGTGGSYCARSARFGVRLPDHPAQTSTKHTASLPCFYFFSFKSTEARVFSQSRFSLDESPPVLSRLIVNCSTACGRELVLMSTRARSWLWS